MVGLALTLLLPDGGLQTERECESQGDGAAIPGAQVGLLAEGLTTAHPTTGACGPRQMQAGEGARSTLLGPGGLPCLQRSRGSPLTAPAHPAAGGVRC